MAFYVAFISVKMVIDIKTRKPARDPQARCTKEETDKIKHTISFRYCETLLTNE